MKIIYNEAKRRKLEEEIRMGKMDFTAAAIPEYLRSHRGNQQYFRVIKPFDISQYFTPDSYHHSEKTGDQNSIFTIGKKNHNKFDISTIEGVNEIYATELPVYFEYERKKKIYKIGGLVDHMVDYNGKLTLVEIKGVDRHFKTPEQLRDTTAQAIINWRGHRDYWMKNCLQILIVQFNQADHSQYQLHLYDIDHEEFALQRRLINARIDTLIDYPQLVELGKKYPGGRNNMKNTYCDPREGKT